jgi:hypothetical protein
VHTCKADGGKVTSCCASKAEQKPVSSSMAHQHT